MGRKYDLQQRLTEFAMATIRIGEQLPRTAAGIHICNQLIKSGSHAALHYGEAQSAESRKDFIHKMKVCLKELRETLNCLTLIKEMKWLKPEEVEPVLRESNELVSIFVTSVKTAEANMRRNPERTS